MENVLERYERHAHIGQLVDGDESQVPCWTIAFINIYLIHTFNFLYIFHVERFQDFSSDIHKVCVMKGTRTQDQKGFI